MVALEHHHQLLEHLFKELVAVAVVLERVLARELRLEVAVLVALAVVLEQMELQILAVAVAVILILRLELAGQVWLFFQYHHQNTQAQPQEVLQLQQAVQTQF
jgi:hypothetical protein